MPYPAFRHSINAMADETASPMIVCICGSMRFKDRMALVAADETIAGNIVVMPHIVKVQAAADAREVRENARRVNPAALDALHLSKIALAQEVIVVALEGYVGESTRREISFAAAHHKSIRWVVE